MIWCVVVKVSCYFLLLSMEKSVLLRQERVNEILFHLYLFIIT